jgi:cyclophilin family peptidyl-prolyl cis-trans isomerase
MGTSKRMRQKQGRVARLEAARQAEKRADRRKLVRNVVIGAVAVVLALVLLSRFGNKNKDDTSTVGTTTTSAAATSTTPSTAPGASIVGATPCPLLDGTSARTITFEQEPPQCLDATKSYTATFNTSEGTVVVDLDQTKAPKAVNDFAVLALYHYYDGTTIFRSNTGIGILQGGSPHTGDSTDPGPGFTVQDEGGTFDFSNPAQPNGTGPFTYADGDLALARSSGPNASGGQYFFGASDNVADLSQYGTYIVLGHTAQGLDVLHAILGLHADTDPSQPGEGAPSKPVTINSVTIQQA